MNNKNIKLSLCFAFLTFTISSCCLKSVKLKPEMNTVDLSKATAGKASIDTNFEFKDCCPTKEQKKLALKLQNKMSTLYDDLLNDRIGLDDYNAKVKAGNNALKNVILVCNGINNESIRKSNPNPVIPLDSSNNKFTRADLISAWANLGSVADDL